MEQRKKDYADYDEVSGNYGKTRIPVGLDIIFGCLSALDKPLNEVELLSFGCGIGNYEIELAKKMKFVTGSDVSEGMIEQAKENSKGVNNVEFCVADARTYKPRRKYDAVFLSQMLHHVRDFGEQVKVLQRSYDVLKKGGVLIVHTCSQRQALDGFWYFGFEGKKNAAERLRKEYLPIPDLIRYMKEIGFDYRRSIVPVDAVLQGESYFDPESVFKKEWRDGTGSWKLCKDDDLEVCLKQAEEMRKNGTLGKFFEEREKIRKEIGQVTFVYGVKKS